MTATARELEDRARRRGIVVRRAHIPLDGLWHGPKRLILIRDGIPPGSPQYVTVLAHELRHATRHRRWRAVKATAAAGAASALVACWLLARHLLGQS